MTGAERSSDEFPIRTEDLKVEILIRPLHTSKSKFSTDLWSPPRRISKRTSGHLKVQNRPLDASASKFKPDLWTPQSRNTKPTSGRETSDPRVLNRIPDTFAGDARDRPERGLRLGRRRRVQDPQGSAKTGGCLKAMVGLAKHSPSRRPAWKGGGKGRQTPQARTTETPD